MNILYIGAIGRWSNCGNRGGALSRIGHNVTTLDIQSIVREPVLKRVSGAIQHRFGVSILERRIHRAITEAAGGLFDLVWINSGDFLSLASLEILRRAGAPVILYNNDDPTGGRDRQYFRNLLRLIPLFDLIVVPRDVSSAEFRALGAKRVLRVPMGYDEVSHRPFEDDAEIPARLRSEVAFVGTWMRGEGRDSLLLDLAARGVPVSIWGNKWQASNFWRDLQKLWRGHAVTGRDYVGAIQGAKVNLGLLSKGNRDLHTSRSVEIPAIGGLLCAQRTSEHVRMYREGEEAIFWSSAKECAEECLALLSDTDRRKKIKAAGAKRVRELSVGNEDICRSILTFLESDESRHKSIFCFPQVGT
jgi:hypothetical protein